MIECENENFLIDRTKEIILTIDNKTDISSLYISCVEVDDDDNLYSTIKLTSISFNKALYNAKKAHKRITHVYIDGISASLPDGQRDKFIFDAEVNMNITEYEFGIGTNESNIIITLQGNIIS